MKYLTPLSETHIEVATRDGFGQGLLELGKNNQNVVALTADLTESTRVEAFAKAYPERFIEVGVAEQNMAGIAAGLALGGKIPFMASYAVFSPGRNWDQIRVSICYSDLNVKIVGAHAGLTVGPDGATHQALEDIAITRVLPNMTVIVPADSIEARKATLALANHIGPAYLRLGRSKVSVITSEKTPFEIGKALKLTAGDDVTIFACGVMVATALKAAKQLDGKVSVAVINLHTIKPIDSTAIIESAKATGAIVTAEEHQVAGGMGSAVAEVVAAHHPVPIEFVGVRDTFGESGEPDELLEHYKLGVDDVLAAVEKVMRRKNAR
ncbi:MAG TPA: transketolase C-terminal domain-containing protein [Candidatus Saccharimonadales bacterium]|nr:transketolase C-terminal domain-containing protein [Candidatus Saccharimonadales bacterium]